jgi:hypothetical protein
VLQQVEVKVEAEEAGHRLIRSPQTVFLKGSVYHAEYSINILMGALHQDANLSNIVIVEVPDSYIYSSVIHSAMPQRPGYILPRPQS